MNIPTSLGSGASVGVNHRRRALFTALIESMSDAARIQDLFHFCEEFCKTEPKFLVNRFLMRAEQAGKVNERERQTLAKALYLALSRSYDQLSRYPANLVGDAEAQDHNLGRLTGLPSDASAFSDLSFGAAPPASGMDRLKHDRQAKHKVFQTVMAHLATRLYHAIGYRPARIGIALRDATIQSNADSATLSMLIDWIDGDLQEDAIPEHLPLEEMREALRVLYLCMSNMAGRTSAAQTLAEGLKLASTLHEAQRFSPKLLV
ncbi:hypothetical protein C7S18_02910 [Ahniella affigens]|uniref:Uncharacterized protein n=1 Tax=Ahniella affigens TaxID=2021234 RepID=A0A2P1PMZ5_9GAMM|nr:hypothetical protein [Ahniella affigens]AVP96205.1 hypothetical protein C7S18_02910 [Ahniella affigens]